MELKVACDCGQKYKFDVEPVGRQMPFLVNCPVCGVDGTPAANQLLAEHFANAVPAPPTSAEPTPGPSGLRINRPPAPAAPPPLAAATPPSPLPGARPVAPVRLMKTPIDAPKDFNMGLGILGAFLGSAVGAALVYGFFLWAQFRFPFTGTVIGLFAGFGARLLARGTDTMLGFVAAAFALITVVGVFFLMYGAFFILGIISIVICVYFAYRIASG